MDAEHFYPAQNELGEGPRWDSQSGCLYWVDILKGDFYRLAPGAAQAEQFHTGAALGCLALSPSGLLLGMEHGFGRWNAAAGQAEPLPGLVLPDWARFNDGALDPAGRFWAGTKAPPGQACLYRLDPDGSIRLMGDGFTICNGLGWSPDARTMYFTDSPRQVIYAYDYDLASGEIANRRVFGRISDPGVEPDGLTVDSQGGVWSALWDGWRLVRFDPKGKIERELRLPCARVTSCCFGGPKMADLYITTAYAGLNYAAQAAQPLAGDLFVAHLG